MGEPAMRLIPGLFGAGLLVTAVGGVAPGRAHAASAGQGWEQSGEASWYGGRHAGRRTSSGATFNPAEMTAAHPSLPLGSRIRVTMQDTGASVIVTVTDRQPSHGYRIIDLSQGAARRIGLDRQGVGLVTLAQAGLDDATPVEVAEAPGGDEPDAVSAALTGSRHGRRHTRPAFRVAGAARPYYRVQSAALVRSSAPHRAARHRL